MLTYQLCYKSANVSLLHVRSDNSKWPYSTPVRLLFTVFRAPKQLARISEVPPPTFGIGIWHGLQDPQILMRGISKDRFQSTVLQKWIGSEGKGEKQAIQVNMPRKVRDNLSCLKQDARRIQYIFRNSYVILIFLKYIWLWKLFEEKYFISNNICTSICVGKLRQIPHNIPSIKAATVILLRYLNISIGWVASDFPSCPLPISEWPVCFPAVWLLVGMDIMGNKFRLVHPLLEWYTVFTLRTPPTTRTTILRKCRRHDAEEMQTCLLLSYF
jgi:hypothetical protein